jgi:hypothetical protein
MGAEVWRGRIARLRWQLGSSQAWALHAADLKVQGRSVRHPTMANRLHRDRQNLLGVSLGDGKIEPRLGVHAMCSSFCVEEPIGCRTRRAGVLRVSTQACIWGEPYAASKPNFRFLSRMSLPLACRPSLRLQPSLPIRHIVACERARAHKRNGYAREPLARIAKVLAIRRFRWSSQELRISVRILC